MQVSALLLHWGSYRRARNVRVLHAEFTQALNTHALPFADLAKSETLADSPETYKRKFAAGTGKRSAAYELAIRSGREYRQGDQIAFYITGDKKRVSVVDNAKLLSDAWKTPWTEEPGRLQSTRLLRVGHD